MFETCIWLLCEEHYIHMYMVKI